MQLVGEAETEDEEEGGGERERRPGLGIQPVLPHGPGPTLLSGGSRPPFSLARAGHGARRSAWGEGPQVLQEEATFLSASSPRDKNTSLQNQLLILLLGRVQAQNCHFVLSLAEQLLLGIRLSDPGSGLGGGTRRQTGALLIALRGDRQGACPTPAVAGQWTRGRCPHFTASLLRGSPWDLGPPTGEGLGTGGHRSEPLWGPCVPSRGPKTRETRQTGGLDTSEGTFHGKALPPQPGAVVSAQGLTLIETVRVGGAGREHEVLPATQPIQLGRWDGAPWRAGEGLAAR